MLLFRWLNILLDTFILNILKLCIKGISITLCKLYADSYMIGGRKNRKKVVGLKASFFWKQKCLDLDMHILKNKTKMTLGIFPLKREIKICFYVLFSQWKFRTAVPKLLVSLGHTHGENVNFKWTKITTPSKQSWIIFFKIKCL